MRTQNLYVPVVVYCDSCSGSWVTCEYCNETWPCKDYQNSHEEKQVKKQERWAEKQNIISDRQYDGLCQIVEQIHDDSPVITERIKDFYVRRIATYLGLTIDKYWTYEGDTTGALENEDFCMFGIAKEGE